MRVIKFLTRAPEIPSWDQTASPQFGLALAALVRTGAQAIQSSFMIISPIAGLSVNSPAERVFLPSPTSVLLSPRRAMPLALTIALAFILVANFSTILT